VSKWYIGLGAIEAAQPWVLVVLALSTLLNAAYFLPVLHAAWFKAPQGPWPEDHSYGRFETHWALLMPPLVAALLAIEMGLFAGTPFSPLQWVRLIVERAYAR
jgi:multicomponent Na+:H+ antiporter subunit D